MTKPVIIYVDDEPRNLAVFEASIPSEWTVHVFESAVDALKKIKALEPWVIVSDQRMPVMTGLEFLEVASQLVPNAVRIVVTGQTEEQTIIQLLRRARIFDYITKPWDTEEFLSRLTNGMNFYKAIVDKFAAIESLHAKNQELAASNDELKRISSMLEVSRNKEVDLRKEIESWVPAPIVWALNEGNIKFPIKQTISGVTFDIINSSSLHHMEVQGRPVRSQILHLFTQAIMRHGGIRESQGGDSAYAYFGAFTSFQDSYVAALAAAQEYRLSLRNFCQLNSISAESGIALHLIPDAMIQLHEIRVEGPNGNIVQKSCVSESAHIDLLHRMEKMVHCLKGSNIILSEAFVQALKDKPKNLIELGSTTLRGQTAPVKMFLIKSDLVSQEELDAFIAEYFVKDLKKVA